MTLATLLSYLLSYLATDIYCNILLIINIMTTIIGINGSRIKLDEKKCEENQRKRDEDEARGFEMIKEFIEKYPKTEYPSVDDNLIELFTRGARQMGYKYLILPEDDDECPECHEVQGKVGRKALSLTSSWGKSTICHWCYVEQSQDEMCKHTPASCDHPKRKDIGEGHDQWCWEDCSSVAEAFEHSYKAILETL